MQIKTKVDEKAPNQLRVWKTSWIPSIVRGDGSMVKCHRMYNILKHEPKRKIFVLKNHLSFSNITLSLIIDETGKLSEETLKHELF